MSKYTEKLGTEADRVILLAQDPENPTKYVPVKAVANEDGTYSVDTTAKVAALDIALSALRDALRGTGSKTLTDIVTALGLQATAAKQDVLAALIGAINDAAVVDPAATGSQIALLKGIIKQLQGDGTAGKAAPVKVAGSTLQEQKTQADAAANVITFSANVVAIEIYHEETTWQTFIVNGLTLTIPAGGYRTPIGGTPAATVTIPAGISCLVGRLV